jgi:hypothetical protein
MTNDQLHEDAVKLLLQRQRNATETTAKGCVKSYNQRRRAATAALQPILVAIWKCLAQGESVGGYTSKEDWASGQSITIRQIQRIISGTPQKRHDVALKVGMTVIVDGAKVALTQALYAVLSKSLSGFLHTHGTPLTKKEKKAQWKAQLDAIAREGEDNEPANVKKLTAGETHAALNTLRSSFNEKDDSSQAWAQKYSVVFEAAVQPNWRATQVKNERDRISRMITARRAAGDCDCTKTECCVDIMPACECELDDPTCCHTDKWVRDRYQKRAAVTV